MTRPLELRNNGIQGAKDRRGHQNSTVHPYGDRLDHAFEAAQPYFTERQTQSFKSQKLESSDPCLVIVRVDRPSRPRVVGERFAENLTGSLEISHPGLPSFNDHPAIIAEVSRSRLLVGAPKRRDGGILRRNSDSPGLVASSQTLGSSQECSLPSPGVIHSIVTPSGALLECQ